MQAAVSVVCVILLMATVPGCWRPSAGAEPVRDSTSNPPRRPEGPISVAPAAIALGEVTPGRKEITSSFVVTNRSARSVKLLGVESSCGCSVAKPDRHILRSGESATVRVLIRPRALGRQRATIRVFCDVGERPVEVPVTWVARSLLQIEPDGFHLAEVRVGEVALVHARISRPSQGGGEVDWDPGIIESVSASPGDELQVVRRDEHDETVLEISVRPRTAGNRRKGSVTLYCAAPVGKVRIPVLWRATESLFLEPKGVYLGPVDAATAHSVSVRVHSGDDPIESVEVVRSHRREELEVERTGAHEWACTLRLTVPSRRGAFALPVDLDVATADGNSARLKVVVAGKVHANEPAPESEGL